MNALQIPADWKTREMQRLGPGVHRLAEPLDWTWRGEAEGLRHAKRKRSQSLTSLDSVAGDPELLVWKSEPLDDGAPWPDVASWFYDEGYGVLKEGGDAYVVVPLGAEVRRGFEVWGLSGPPLSLVRLGSVAVATGEGRAAKSMTYSLGALAYGLDLIPVAIGLGTSPALMFIGGALPPWDPWYRENLPKTPW